jgi:hypothetical protein
MSTVTTTFETFVGWEANLPNFRLEREDLKADAYPPVKQRCEQRM